MTAGRSLSGYDSFLVDNMEGQVRILAQLAELEPCAIGAASGHVTARRVADLHKELLTLQNAMNEHLNRSRPVSNDLSS